MVSLLISPVTPAVKLGKRLVHRGQTWVDARQAQSRELLGRRPANRGAL